MVAPTRLPVNGAFQNTVQEAENSSWNKIKIPLLVAAICIVSYMFHSARGTRNSSSELPVVDAVDVVESKDDGEHYFTEPSTEIEYPYEALRSTSKRMFVLQPEDEFTPKIAWLMSFPNSGTSYTMVMTARASEKAYATNYGEEVTSPEMGNTLSIYPRRPEGPYWAGKSGIVSKARPLPDNYVLTKTHCGSRCMDCPPHEYIETPKTFLRKCATGHRRKVFGEGVEKWRRIDTEYPPERVYKAIHLIRNPMHNTIARFHLDYRNREKSSSEEVKAFTKKYKQDKKGFRAWCKDLDSRYSDRGKAYFSKESSPVSWEIMKKVPCHDEIFKWTQWHNMAYESIELIKKEHHDVPLLTIHYENYASKFNETVDSIMGFLELEKTEKLREFSARSDYDSYYKPDHVEGIRKIVKAVANENTWKQVKHYFSD